jgi:serine/threonine-protein kinase RsbW
MKTTSQATQFPSLELSFPSELGYEKIARDTVAAFARRLGFDQERIEDLKTALGEACINAIEHGNRRTPGLSVDVVCMCEEGRLTIEVHDRGLNRYEDCGPLASIEKKLNGLAPLRGMGLMMIAQLVDEAGFTDSSDGGNHFRLALYYRKPS